VTVTDESIEFFEGKGAILVMRYGLVGFGEFTAESVECHLIGLRIGRGQTWPGWNEKENYINY
jgi:hypothetical protein